MALLVRSFTLILCVYLLTSRIPAKMVVTSINLLDDHNDPSKIKFLNITTKDQKQYLNFFTTLAAPLDQNVGAHYLLEYAADGKHYIKIRLLKEKNACRAYNAYAGPLWHDIERAAGIAPGVCPIAAGNYTVRNHLLDFDKMTFNAIPYGKVKLTIVMVKNANQAQFNGFALELING